MLFDFNQSKDLLTPPIYHGGVIKNNPILTSSDIFSLDDNDIYFSSTLSKKNEYNLITKNNINENIDDDHQQEQQDDLFSTFELPVLSELDKSELQNDVSEFDKYLSQTSFPSPPMDGLNSSISDDSTYPWVAEECTIDSSNTGDMTVPLSPPFSSASLSPSISRKKSTKKKSLSTIIERKLRKKDQNKTAAEKYRFKKRTERVELITRHTDLKKQNQELKYKFENLTFKLEQLKQLFVDVLQIQIPSIESN